MCRTIYTDSAICSEGDAVGKGENLAKLKAHTVQPAF